MLLPPQTRHYLPNTKQPGIPSLSQKGGVMDSLRCFNLSIGLHKNARLTQRDVTW